MNGYINNTLALCFILGWQGGTIHQVAKELDVAVDTILNADEVQMGELCRKAQGIYWRKDSGDVNQVLLKHLGFCVATLKSEYDGHDIPAWLERAAGVHKIVSEYYPTTHQQSS